LGCIRQTLTEAREAGDRRPPFAIVASCLGELGVEIPISDRSPVRLEDARDRWLRRLRSSRRTESTVTAYRIALDDLMAWLARRAERSAFVGEEDLVAYLEAYRRRRSPAPATYYRRFVLLRRFFRWVSAESAAPDPFLELDAPPKPQHAADWLTPDEFARMLKAAGEPSRSYPGLAERDQLVLLALVITGLRRAELIALDWGDLTLDGTRPSALIRSGKGGRPRRQPLPPALAAELVRVHRVEGPSASEPVFRGLRGGRLQPTILAGIIRRTATGAGLEKRVTAHTLRHTAATWLRHATGDTRLVAEYLGHADLSTVHRYAHVAGKELDGAAAAIAETAGLGAA